MLLQDSYVAAQVYLDTHIRVDEPEEIVICSCQEFPSAWVFGYNSRRFLEDFDVSASLIGNGPVVVPKDGGPLYLARPDVPVEVQLGGSDSR